MKCIAVIAWMFILAGVARADFPPPEQTQCDGRREGDDCALFLDSGRSQVGRCISKPDCERPEHPEVGRFACLICTAGPAAPGSGGLPVIPAILAGAVLVSLGWWYLRHKAR